MISNPSLTRTWTFAAALVLPALAVWAIWAFVVTGSLSRASKAGQNAVPSVTGERAPAASERH